MEQARLTTYQVIYIKKDKYVYNIVYGADEKFKPIHGYDDAAIRQIVAFRV